MNKRYTETFLFLSRLSHKSNKGFVLPFVLCTGVVIAGTGALMLLRSSSESEKVVAQQAIAQGKTASEVAMARMQYVLGKYPFIAEKSETDWQTEGFDTYAKEQIEIQLKNTCEEYTEDDITERKTELDQYVKNLAKIPISEAKGYFQIIDYKPAIAGQTMGELTMEVKANDGNQLKEAPTRLVAKIPLSQNSAEIPYGPGLWVKEASGLDDIVAAHVWIGSGGDDCSVADDADKINEINTKVFGTKGGLKEAIKDGELSNGTTFKPAMVAKHKFPDENKLKEVYTTTVIDVVENEANIPKIDLSSNSDALGEYPDQSFANPLSTFASFMNGVGEKALQNVFGRAAVASTSDCGTQMPANKNGSGFYVFPRPDDTATRSQVMEDGQTICIYDYRIDQDLSNVGIVARTVNSEGKRQRVIFHLKHNVDGNTVNIDKNTEIAHIGNDDLGDPDGKGSNKPIAKIKDVPDCTGDCKPIDFQIWGHDTTSVCLNGNKKLHAFLWAPLADMGVMGSGNGKGGLNGTAFINTWNKTCGSDGKSGAHVVQTGEWSDLGLEEPDMIPPKTVGQPANVKFEEFSSDG